MTDIKFGIDPKTYPYRDGSLYVGGYYDFDIKDLLKPAQHVGVMTSRHAITIAGSRGGKGAGVIIPNLIRWPHNALVIDPKGEAATATWEHRKAKGQAVHVLDPFGQSKVPDDVRASYNPLDDLDINGLTLGEDIDAIADGMVMRSGDAGAVTWDNGAVQLLSGLIAYVVAHVEPKDRNLVSVRKILIDQREGGMFDVVIDQMAGSEHPDLGDLMRSGASRALAGEGKYYVSGAQANTKWLDSKGIRQVVSKSTFSMRDLKRKKASVFVALPFKYLPQQQHGRFLRLMTRCGINAMQEQMPNGDDLGERCLFILDEFFSLGYIDEVATGIGGMAGYGLHMWPFLQDIDQLWKLYGRDGAGTFFGSSDIHQFFANTDTPTLEFISNAIGNFTIDDMPSEPVMNTAKYDRIKAELDHLENNPPLIGNLSGSYMGSKMGLSKRLIWAAEDMEDAHQERLQRFNTEVSRVLGKPRLAPDQIATLVQIEESGGVAKNQIVFVHGRKPMVCKVVPYFIWPRELSEVKRKALPAPAKALPTPAKALPKQQTNWVENRILELGVSKDISYEEYKALSSKEKWELSVANVELWSIYSTQEFLEDNEARIAQKSRAAKVRRSLDG